MAIKFNSILGTLLALVIAAVLFHVSAAQGGRREVLAGGWRPIKNITDPEVVEIGKFAVNEHNKEAKTKLEFEKIMNGESQVVAGINYRLVIAAKDGGEPHQYMAEVWDKPWEKYRNLTSFKDLRCNEEKGEQNCISA
ncbi:cysteine proteinase inhibitor 1-like [Nicotiana tabacum]|uniref:Cysteine proteinase inhibitor 1-like n=1 Tax=Nicotiana tabacum TaxID=4097 RepID=A0A1S4AB43_TOBAC|nr:cysteine proteinase inhibitor 1-like [Nicotiana tomentosiformis]XP_016473829.1 PREDICTED: cysteine proteinase inhibitor 1-like [Nicotiana tabacum]